MIDYEIIDEGVLNERVGVLLYIANIDGKVKIPILNEGIKQYPDLVKFIKASWWRL